MRRWLGLAGLAAAAVLAGCRGGDLPVAGSPSAPVIDPTSPTPVTPATPTPPSTPPPTGPTDSGTVALPPACTGLAGAPGLSLREVEIDGGPRTFRVYAPDGLDPNAAVPVVLVYHGYTMSGEIMERITTWDAVADREGFVVVYADGANLPFGDPWNVGDPGCGAGAFSTSTADDFGFTLAMLDDVAADQCIDRSRVFATGFSMGAYFVHHLACRGPAGLVRAVAPHSGGTYDGDCDNGPVPMLILHGSADPIIFASCGAEAAEVWRDRDGCAGDPWTFPVEGGTCAVSDACDGEASVTHCLFDGMDHGWAGSSDLLYGGGRDYADAAELAWTLFAQF